MTITIQNKVNTLKEFSDRRYIAYYIDGVHHKTNLESSRLYKSEKWRRSQFGNGRISLFTYYWDKANNGDTFLPSFLVKILLTLSAVTIIPAIVLLVVKTFNKYDVEKKDIEYIQKWNQFKDNNSELSLEQRNTIDHLDYFLTIKNQLRDLESISVNTKEYLISETKSIYDDYLRGKLEIYILNKNIELENKDSIKKQSVINEIRKEFEKTYQHEIELYNQGNTASITNYWEKKFIKRHCPELNTDEQEQGVYVAQKLALQTEYVEEAKEYFNANQSKCYRALVREYNDKGSGFPFYRPIKF